MDKSTPPDHRKPPKEAQFPDAVGRARTCASKLVAGAGVSGSSPLVGYLFFADLQVKREGKEVGQDLSQPNLPQPYCNPDKALLIEVRDLVGVSCSVIQWERATSSERGYHFVVMGHGGDGALRLPGTVRQESSELGIYSTMGDS